MFYTYVTAIKISMFTSDNFIYFTYTFYLRIYMYCTWICFLALFINKLTSLLTKYLLKYWVFFYFLIVFRYIYDISEYEYTTTLFQNFLQSYSKLFLWFGK